VKDTQRRGLYRVKEDTKRRGGVTKSGGCTEASEERIVKLGDVE